MNCPDAFINVSSLTVQRGDTTILQDVDWRVERRQHWAILGANGSGKTSLLKALTAYLTPSRGKITINGQTYGQSDWSKLRQRIGLVSSGISQKVPLDEPALKTVLSGPTAQLGYWTRDANATNETLARECLQRMGAAHLAERPWMHLSQGERQRVFIARALMTQPVLLILDEPCAGLDPVMREQFLGSVSSLMAENDAPNIVLVTHHVEEIVPGFTHTLVLKDGRALRQGPTIDVLTGDCLSDAFNARIHIEQRNGRWRLELADQ